MRLRMGLLWSSHLRYWYGWALCPPPPPGVLWKLKRPLRGLRCAPQRWGEERPNSGHPGGLDKRHLSGDCWEVPSLRRRDLSSAKTAKVIWNAEAGESIVGHSRVYVDGDLITARTSWLEAVLRAVQSNWECTILGVAKRDEEDAAMAFPQTVFLSVTVEQEE